MRERTGNYASPLSPHLRLSVPFRLLGLLPLAFFSAQAIHYWRTNELGNMFWVCNIGNLLLAMGLLLDKAVLIRVAVLWIIPGLLVWVLYVVLPWGVFLSSILAHVGGIIVGLIALRKVGMDRASWLYALGWFLIMQILSRFLTPTGLNVNLSHRIQEGWLQVFDAYWKFWLVLILLAAVLLWTFGMLLYKVWPVRPSWEGNTS
jgi:hypothetical protein